MLEPTNQGRLGDLLVEEGIISNDQLKVALTEQKKHYQQIGKILVKLGFVSETVMRDFLSKSYRQESVDLSKIVLDSEAVQRVPQALARRHCLLPLTFDHEHQTLLVAMSDIFNVVAVDQLAAELGGNIHIKLLLAGETEIIGALDNAYGFDLSAQTAFSIGGYVYDQVYANLMDGGEPGTNWSTDIFKRWNQGNTKTDVPRVSAGDQNANATSSRFLTSASYFSLRNITLGYTFSKKLTEKYKIDKLRIYAVGDNLWMLSARKGLDPRQSFSGVTTSGTYSALRTMSLGLSVSF